MPAGLEGVAGRLRRVEERLARLLAAGWREGRAEAEALAGEADALAVLGLPELAGRLRAVAGAPSAAELLRAAALAASACALVRARLPLDGSPPAGAAPLGAAGGAKGRPQRERLLPLGRMAVGGEAPWACLRMRGGVPVGWVLADLPEGAAPGQSDGDWLARPVLARLAWRARYPLGAVGEVERVAGAEVAPVAAADLGPDPLRPVAEALAGTTSELPALGYPGVRGAPTLESVFPDKIDAYAWVDPAAADACRAAVAREAVTWTLGWAEGGETAPLVLLHPGWPKKVLRRGWPARRSHLVAGAPDEELE